jgi:hypothetical protein
MHLQREYVTYMARELMKRLSAQGLVQYEQPDFVHEVISQVMLDELSIEDRINDEARKILEAHGDQMKQLGATYEDAFKAIKKQLVRERKVIL